MHLGAAFQLIDDVLDYGRHSNPELGKNVGDDLAEGSKPTLPLIHALKHGKHDQQIFKLRAVITGRRRRADRTASWILLNRQGPSRTAIRN